jgi:hypothetical protein
MKLLLIPLQNQIINNNLISNDNNINTKSIKIIPENKVANIVATYNTVKFHTLQQMVQWFHEAWMHCNLNHMIDIVDNNLYQGLPEQLTSTVIRKHFPYQCQICPIGNLARRPLQGNSLLSQSNLPKIGESWEIDIKREMDRGRW